DTGLNVNIISYSIFGTITGMIVFVCLILIYRCIYKPDLSKLKDFDVVSLKSDIQPMTKQEKITASVFITVIIIWILQGSLSNIAPTIGEYISSLGNAVPVMVGIVILCMLKIDGKPI